MSVRSAPADTPPTAALTAATAVATVAPLAAAAAAPSSVTPWLFVLAAAIAIAGVGSLAWGWPRRQAPTRTERELTGPPDDNDPERADARCGCFLYTADSLHEAQLVLDVLEDEGIEATLFNQHLVGAMGELPVSQCWPKIWLVDESNHDAARTIVDAYEARKRLVSDATRRCDACGEDSPDNFEVCWSCRAPFEA